jgi:NADP-dependent 3-hydroxy acid dehydrogenase YdfG
MVLAASTPKHAHREHRNLPGPDIDDAGGKQTGDQILASGGQALFLHHDVTQEQQWIGVVAGTQERFRGVDVLFNNASIYIIAPLTEITVETWNHLMAINVTGMFLGMKHTVPAMLARGGGSIINASSVAGLRPLCPQTLRHLHHPPSEQ